MTPPGAEVLALLCPGQGSQKPGMLSPWLGTGEPGPGEQVLALARAASEATGLDLLRLGTQAPAEEIRDTAVAQPLIVLVSLASALHHDLLAAPDPAGSGDGNGVVGGAAVGAGTAVVGGGAAVRPGGHSEVVAGHSLGALTALALAGALSPLEAVRLAAVRGQAMARCCQDPAEEPSGMTALLGGEREAVVAAAQTAGLCLANVNCSTQAVVAGPLSALRSLKLPAGTRAVTLEVAGAFHTPLMAPAAPALAQAVSELPDRPLQRAVVDEATGALHPAGGSSARLLTDLVAHLTAPVRWDLVQQRLADLEVTQAVELAPAGTLAGFARRDLPQVAVTRLRAPAA
ncbi:ACP S-malonyltransferase [Actinomyces weissii]|uniref:[acyl-carrier-protein] S-malonyltransferase n=1 Tax=Actinomyces weissii TaxID=675090 RepID=A0A7T7S297_9ACTO|nr:acyltransferase domain-containing protein [Actinomyces weissii]QQM68113.1 ACP S-malonyltransferase [Actinomyces weissii]